MSNKQLREIMNMECSAMEGNQDLMRHGGIKNIMIVVQCADDHIHCQCPPIPVAKSMIMHVDDMIRREDRSRLIIPGHRLDGF
jgi:hypothetical protein